MKRPKYTILFNANQSTLLAGQNRRCLFRLSSFEKIRGGQTAATSNQSNHRSCRNLIAPVAVPSISMSLNQVPRSGARAGSDRGAFATTDHRTSDGADAGSDKCSF
jgi:hypothetical protein